MPVYNDWPSFRQLLREVDRVAATLPCRIFVSAVNDGSTEEPGSDYDDFSDIHHLAGAERINLAGNMGHQRAVAIGLCQAVTDDDFDAILIMDADGEDPPRAIEDLLRSIGGRTDYCIVAQRRKRTETIFFRVSYFAYKCIFKLVTGKTINFGNFSVLSRSFARRLVTVADLWNNLPAAILRSRLPMTSVPVDRGNRYEGESKMNFTALAVHGFSGISVYSETIFIRLLILTIFLFVFGSISIATVLILRFFFPVHATPGWATTVTFGLTIILLQVFFTALSSILMLLNARVQRLIVPIVDFRAYVAERQLFFGQTFAESIEKSDWASTLVERQFS